MVGSSSPIEETLSALSPAELAQRFIDKGHVPQETYDFKPMLTAMYERTSYLTQEGIEGMGERWKQVDASLVDNQPAEHQGKPVHNPPPKVPGSGSWDCLLYVPAWSDPEYVPGSRLDSQRYKRKVSAPRDALQMLRPALLAQDAIRNPTAYAKRWGIHPDRLDGRSRLSPSNSTTRNVMGVLQAQLDDVSPGIRKQLVSESIKRGLNGPSVLMHEQGPIDPEVFEEWKVKNNIPGIKEVLDTATINGTAYEQYVQSLPGNVREAYQSLIQEILDDEDWQRLLFRDLTTDEMIRQNIHTMSDTPQIDLRDDPLHELVEKKNWADTTWRGNGPESPRYCYQLNGERQEWDVVVSRVLRSNPPFWQALRELRTRQLLDDDYDPRDPSDRHIPNLTVMVPVDQIDMALCWDPIKKLDALSFKSVEAVDNMLSKHIQISIVSGFIEFDTGKRQTFVYGCCQTELAGPSSTITLYISAELIWPLLTPAYSSSERICTSMLVATTILHELQHAVSGAIRLLTTDEPDIHPPDRSKEVIAQLRDVGDLTMDMSVGFGEPYWDDDDAVELGYAFENSLFGMCMMSFLQNEDIKKSDDVSSLPLAVSGEAFPHQGAPHLLKNVPHPIENYEVGIPIEWYQRFFTNKFWDDDLPQWGHEIFKMLPPDRTYLTIMDPRSMSRKAMASIIGMTDWRFADAVLQLLHENGMSIMAEYCRHCLWDVRGCAMLRSRWGREVVIWEDTHNPIDVAIHSLYAAIKEGAKLLEWSSNTDARAAHEKWKKDNIHVDPPGETTQAWLQRMQIAWTATWGVPGNIVRLAMNAYTLLQKDIGIRQRIVFELLSVRYEQRVLVYQKDMPSDPITSLLDNRLKYYYEWANCVAVELNKASEWPTLFPNAGIWKYWTTRFASLIVGFGQLIEIIECERVVSDQMAETIRQSLNTVPSSLWQSKLQRLKKLAFKEYNLLDPRIRAAVDEFNNRIEKYRRKRLFEGMSDDAIDMAKLGTLKLPAPSKEQTTPKSQTIFSFNPPKVSKAPPAAGNVQTTSTPVAQFTGNNASGSGFAASRTEKARGSPWAVDKALDSRRYSQAVTKASLHADARRISSGKNWAQDAAAKGLVSFTTANKFQSQVGANVLAGASWAPSPGAPGLAPVATSSSGFTPGGFGGGSVAGPSVSGLFPNPFATRTTTTNDIVNAPQAQPTNFTNALQNVGHGPGYTFQSLD
ncbi:hypothetical protein BJ170DRAFT_730044 [Xylariales sp. AK1849]|nr:hypothetical protein BJ170DRAFT_730044 [Xylariales sp. AK1849]